MSIHPKKGAMGRPQNTTQVQLGEPMSLAGSLADTCNGERLFTGTEMTQKQLYPRDLTPTRVTAHKNWEPGWGTWPSRQGAQSVEAAWTVCRCLSLASLLVLEQGGSGVSGQLYGLVKLWLVCFLSTNKPDLRTSWIIPNFPAERRTLYPGRNCYTINLHRCIWEVPNI